MIGSVSDFFKEEDEYLYQKGREQVRFEVITHMITKLGLSDEQIVEILGFSIDFVKSVRESLPL